MLGLLRLLRLAALRELRGGWLLMLGAAALLIIAAGLVALPLVFRAASADLALRELIEQSPRGATFADHSRAFRPADPEDFDLVWYDAEEIRERHIEGFAGLVGDTRRIMESPLAPGRYLRLDNGINESLPAYLMSFEQLESNAQLVRGDWAQSADEVVIGAALAEQIGLDVGSVVSFSDEMAFEITGVIEPVVADVSRVLAFHYTDVWFSTLR